MMEEGTDLVFICDHSLSLETRDDFRIILSRQRKLVLTLFGEERISHDSEKEKKKKDVTILYEKSEIQQKIANILLSSTLNDTNFSNMKLDAAIILAALTSLMGNSRSDELQEGITRELITALRTISEKELLCDVFLSISLHCCNPEVRNHLLHVGLIDALVWKYSLTSEDIDITRAILHLLSSVFKPWPRMPLAQVFSVLPILSTALHSSDTRTISDAATAIGYLLEESEGEEILNSDSTIAPTLVQLLMHSSEDVVGAAMKAVGHIIAKNESTAQTMIELQVVPSLLWLVDYPNSKVRQEALWSMSNISVGSHSQIQSLVDAGVVPRIMPFMRYWASDSKEEKDLYEEAAWILANMLNSGTDSQRRYLLSENVLEAFCAPLRNLTPLETLSKQVILEGILCLLRFVRVDFAGSKEMVSSFFQREKLSDLFAALKESEDMPPSLHPCLTNILDLLKELKME